MPHILHRQCQVPLLGYFRKRADRKWVTFFGAAALVLFLYGTADATFELHWIPEGVWALFSFTVLVAILLWIVVTVLASHILLEIKARCNKLYNSVENYNRRIVSDETDVVL